MTVGIANAGLVVLHPFLPALLARLGAVGPAGERAGVANMARACRLVNSLAGDPIDAADAALGSSKLLCGLDPAVPLPASDPDPGDPALGAALLTAAVAAWPALAASSAASLQETFLRRRGELSRDAGGWRLAVAGGAFDMLLDRLPWRLSPIVYPWLPAAIAVAWGAARDA